MTKKKELNLIDSTANLLDFLKSVKEKLVVRLVEDCSSGFKKYEVFLKTQKFNHVQVGIKLFAVSTENVLTFIEDNYSYYFHSMNVRVAEHIEDIYKFIEETYFENNENNLQYFVDKIIAMKA